MNWRPVVGVGGATALGAAFLAAAAIKLTDHGMSSEGPMSGLSYFAAQVRQQGILAGSVSFLIAGAVVAVELTVGIWLMAHVRRAAALWTAIVLLAAFSVYLVALIELAGDQPCACYGSFSGQMASSALWRNAGLSALAVLGLAAQRQERRSLA